MRSNPLIATEFVVRFKMTETTVFSIEISRFSVYFNGTLLAKFQIGFFANFAPDSLRREIMKNDDEEMGYGFMFLATALALMAVAGLQAAPALAALLLFGLGLNALGFNAEQIITFNLTNITII